MVVEKGSVGSQNSHRSGSEARHPLGDVDRKSASTSDESLAKAIAELNSTIVHSHQATVHAIQELSYTVEKLAFSDTNDGKPSEEDHAADIALSVERAQVRLDGLEVYAVVSALTVATSISCFDTHGGDGNWDTLIQQQRYLSVLSNIIFLMSSAVGLVAGMHATLVFSLMTMYGRTAVGVGSDAEFLEFFQATGKVRYRGFQAFRLSLYSFLLQVLFMITEQSPPSFRVFGLALLMYLVYTVYCDTQGLIETAGKILFSKKASTKKSATATAYRRNSKDFKTGPKWNHLINNLHLIRDAAKKEDAEPKKEAK